MTHTKHKKRDADSSSSDESSSSDSSSSSSDSDGSKKKHSEDKTKQRKISEPRKNETHGKGRLKRAELEQSKWDSPVEKIKNNRKLEHQRRRSQSRDERDSRQTRRNDEHQDRHARRDDRGPREQDRNRNPERRDRNYEHERRDDRGQHNRDDRYRREDRNRDNRDRRDKRERSNDRKFTNFRNNKRRRSRSGSFNHKEARWGKEDLNQGNSDKPKEKEKPNFGLSGKLTEETNTFKGFVIKYSEPPEARKPKRRWRLYPFKGEKALQTLYIHRDSAYLIGRERKIVDLAVDHPSCSKQHAVLQYRLVSFAKDDGSTGKRVRPYLIDLESANGTFINNQKIDSKKYVELLEKDVIKFGFSSREYVLLHENSKDEAEDDDVKDEEVVEKVKKEPKE